MPGAAELRDELELDLDDARGSPATRTSSRSRYRFVDDCETPVSAFLKLRERFPGPSFLLESAEQGRLGRYSFLGFRPRIELRWSDGTLTETVDGDVSERRSPIPTGPSPRSSAGSRSPRPSACRRSPAARSASSATTSSARSSRSASRTPTRSGSPTWR